MEHLTEIDYLAAKIAEKIYPYSWHNAQEKPKAINACKRIAEIALEEAIKYLKAQS